jgi:hypothetical protein
LGTLKVVADNVRSVDSIIGLSIRVHYLLVAIPFSVRVWACDLVRVCVWNKWSSVASSCGFLPAQLLGVGRVTLCGGLARLTMMLSYGLD